MTSFSGSEKRRLVARWISAMISRTIKQCIWCMVLLHVHGSLGQDRDTPLIRNFTPRDAMGGKKNWDIAQDSQGLMYFANSQGVLIYDGENWELTPLIGGSMCRGLTVDHQDRVYVGGVHEFGYLERNGFEPTTYVSLSKSLENRSFGNIWHIYATSHGVYYQAAQSLFKWREGELSPMAFSSKKGVALDHSTVVFLGEDHHLWLLTPSGLHQLVGSRVANVVADRVQLLLTKSGDLLVINGLFQILRYDAASLKRAAQSSSLDKPLLAEFTREAKDYLSSNELYTATILDSGFLAMGTAHGGILVCDAHGRMEYVINRKTGLFRDRVQDLFCDANSNLWAAMSNGIALAEIHTPLSQYDGERSGFQDPTCFERQNDVLYMGASNGLFMLKSGQAFQLIRDERNSVRDLHHYQNHLLMVSDRIYLVEGENLTALHLPYQQIGTKLYCLKDSKRFKNCLFLGSRQGMFCIVFSEKWGADHLPEVKEVLAFPQVPDRVLRLTQDLDGNLWLHTRSKGLFHLTFHGSSPQSYKVTPYSSASDLSERPHMALLEDGVRLTSEKGVFRIEKSSNNQQPTFVRDERFQSFYDRGLRIHQLEQREDGPIWAATSEGIGFFNVSDKGALVWRGSPLQRLGSGSFFLDEKDQVWANTPVGLYRYHPRGFPTSQKPFQTLIRTLEIDGVALVQTDSGKTPTSHQLQHKTLSFSFAATTFQVEGLTWYRYMLEGADSHWSTWSRQTRASYNNLPGGRYQFLVQARNIHGNISNTAGYAFVVPKLLRERNEIILAGFLVLLSSSLGMLALYMKRKHKVEQKKMLAGAQQQKLEALGSLASGIAHDFNRVLAAIFGYTSLIKEELGHHPSLARPILEIERASESGRDLVDQILNFSRRDKANFEPINLTELLQNALNLAQIAFPPGIVLVRQIRHEPLWVNGNKSRLQQAVLNLCQNAVEAIGDAGGKVLVSLEEQNQKALLMVQDNGEGMSAQVRTRIFEPFFTTRSQDNGTGLGLAMIHGIVDEMDGHIKVRSKPGVGSQFILTFQTLAVPSEKSSPLRSQLIGKRLLCINNNQTELRNNVLMLRKMGYKVSGMGRDEHPLHALRRDPESQDLVILWSPGHQEEDYLILQEIREIHSHLPLLLCLEKQQALVQQGHGFSAVLVKPFSHETFTQKIAELLDHPLLPAPEES